MKQAIVGGVVLAGLVAAWTLVMGITGWYADPVLSNAFFAVVLIQIVVLIVLLARTRAERGWFAQVGVGTLASLVAAVLVFGNSILFTTVLFPEYFEELRAVQERMLREQGLDEARVQAEIAATAAMQTPFVQAFAGFAGTLITGIVVSIVAGLFLRRTKS